MLDSLYRIVALTRKELLAILKDPRSRFSIIVPPILQCLIYGYVATYDLNHVPYAAFDRDRSAASQQLLARIDGSGVFQRVANLDRDVDIKTFIDNKRALLVIQSIVTLSAGCCPICRVPCKSSPTDATQIPPARRSAMSMTLSTALTPIGATVAASRERQSRSQLAHGTTRTSKPAGT